MEDKQIYTTARSEEIKRMVLKFKKDLELKINKYKKDKEKKSGEKIASKEFKPGAFLFFSKKEKRQNIQTSLDNEDLKKSKKVKTQTGFSNKDSLSFISDETIYKITVYTIFGLIVLIIAIGIYFTYSK